MTTHVHLVGSVALDTAQDVFSTAGKLLGPYLARIPDGEPADGVFGSAGRFRCCAPTRTCRSLRLLTRPASRWCRSVSRTASAPRSCTLASSAMRAKRAPRIRIS